MRSENAAILKLAVILKSVWLCKGGMLAGISMSAVLSGDT